MLLTLTTTHRPATDLGYLLGKNPARAQSFSLPFGDAHVLWPEAGDERATAALLVDVDPVALVRGRQGSPSGGPLAAYVNDRPYVASSFLAVALGRVYRSGLAGNSKERAALVETPIPLDIRVDVVAARGGPALLERLFVPLGWTVEAERLPRDPEVPAWGDSALYRLRLVGTHTVQAALQHLYVLLPVLDDDKHYWVGRDEVDKLLAKGGDWLAEHPEKETITRRYLKHFRALARTALAELEDVDAEEGEEDSDAAEDEATKPRREQALEKPLKLNDQRHKRVVEVLVELGARSVVDLGCGEGKLLRRLLKERSLETVVGVDVSARSLDIAERKLDNPRSPLNWRDRLTLLHGSAVYADSRLQGHDAIVVVEVIEHIDAGRLGAFEAAVFGHAHSPAVVVTTPNVEYNALFPSLPAGTVRHADHRFEWTRAEFETWARRVAEDHGYEVTFEPIGPVDPALGAPTQMGVFRCR